MLLSYCYSSYSCRLCVCVQVVRFIREESMENMQIIVISLKEEFFSKSDALLGVYSDVTNFLICCSFEMTSSFLSVLLYVFFFTVWCVHDEPHSEPRPATFPSHSRGLWKAAGEEEVRTCVAWNHRGEHTFWFIYCFIDPSFIFWVVLNYNKSHNANFLPILAVCTALSFRLSYRSISGCFTNITTENMFGMFVFCHWDAS